MTREQTESEGERAWLDEVERRIERARTGEEPSLEGHAVIARLRAKLLAYRHERET